MQNTVFLKRYALPLALIGAVFSSSLVGCGGGSGSGSGFPPFGGNPTPTPTSTTPTPVALTPFAFTLANGQKVTLTGTRTGNNISGTLKVAAKTTAPFKARLSKSLITKNATFPFQITAGDYSYTGTVTPPRTFTLNGNFGGLGDFTMTGLLPTATQAGSFSLTTNGVTDTGVIPSPGTTTPPTTPPTGNIPDGINLTFTPSRPSNFDKGPLKVQQVLLDTDSSGKKNLAVTVNGDQFTGRLIGFSFQVQLFDAMQGKVYTMPSSAVALTYQGNITNPLDGGGAGATYLLTGGKITVNVLSTSKAALTFENVIFTARQGTAQGDTVKVNGTLSVPVPQTTPPVVGNYAVSGSLAVSNVTSGSTVITSPINTFAYTPKAGEFGKSPLNSNQSVSFGGTDKNLTGNGQSRGISIGAVSSVNNFQSPVPFSVGQRFNLANNRTFNSVIYSQTTVQGTSIGFAIWNAISGELVVKAVGTNSITLEFVNVRMQGFTITGNVDPAAGAFTLNGTIAATGLTVKTD